MFAFDVSIVQYVIAALLSLLAFGFILRQTVHRPRSITGPISVPDNTDRRAILERYGPMIVKQLEGQLADYSHAVEVQLQSKIAVLDRLIADADREIIRLEELLAETRRAETPVSHKLRQPDAIVPHEQRRAA
jgi:hypothetical protein